jgi:hypothetical protein
LPCDKQRFDLIDLGELSYFSLDWFRDELLNTLRGEAGERNRDDCCANGNFRLFVFLGIRRKARRPSQLAQA